MTDKVQKIRVEIKDRISNYQEYIDSGYGDEEVIKQEELKDLLTSIDLMQKEPVSEDLEEAAQEYTEKGSKCQEELDAFKDGANWQKQQMLAKAVDATVHIDAGDYPYIPQIELYDYDKDIPLAKEGDKYKVILIKEN